MANKSVAEGKVLVDLGGGAYAEQTVLVSSAPTTVSVLIPNGATSSAAGVAVPSGTTPVGIASPAAWTAAALTFDVSWDGGSTYAPLYDETVEYAVTSLTTATARYHRLDPQLFLGVTHLKARSGLAGAGVTQGADRTLTLVCRGLA